MGFQPVPVGLGGVIDRENHDPALSRHAVLTLPFPIIETKHGITVHHGGRLTENRIYPYESPSAVRQGIQFESAFLTVLLIDIGRLIVVVGRHLVVQGGIEFRTPVILREIHDGEMRIAAIGHEKHGKRRQRGSHLPVPLGLSQTVEREEGKRRERQ